jgi:hypothetical protein
VVRLPAARFASDVAEIQGLYGAFTFPEKLLQKIWLRREFERESARTVDGRRVRVIDPGKWNRLGGPDFRVARLKFDDGPEIIGDVELHLSASDWDAHGHARDPAYNNVVLHVVLFWPEPGCPTRGNAGQEIPILPLLPLLQHDLEEYAADEAVESLANRPMARLMNDLSAMPLADVRALLARHAAARWQQKVHFARVRINRLGWDAACHHAALEVLGFRYNRSPMLRIAARWPLSNWRDAAVTAEAAFESETGSWSVQGVRPANHPKARIRQYVEWVRARPQWTSEFTSCVSALSGATWSENTAAVRRQGQFSTQRENLADAICGGVVGGTRFDTLLCDALLPLLAAKDDPLALRGAWFHWFCGDLSPFIPAGLRHLGVWNGREQPACHGFGQGLLGWLVERELRR